MGSGSYGMIVSKKTVAIISVDTKSERVQNHLMRIIEFCSVTQRKENNKYVIKVR